MSGKKGHIRTNNQPGILMWPLIYSSDFRLIHVQCNALWPFDCAIWPACPCVRESMGYWRSSGKCIDVHTSLHTSFHIWNGHGYEQCLAIFAHVKPGMTSGADSLGHVRSLSATQYSKNSASPTFYVQNFKLALIGFYSSFYHGV